MIKENIPLINNFTCRICYENIINPKKFCECKENLFYHKECFNKWLKINPQIDSCEICNHKLNLKSVYSKYGILKYILSIILILSFCIYTEIVLVKTNESFTNNKNNIIFFNFIGLFFLIRLFYFIFVNCLKKVKYILPIDE